MTDRNRRRPLTPPLSDGESEGEGEGEGEDVDPIADILSLKLKKPKHWKWELTTSRSCSNIAMPRVLLYDHRGDLLVDANTQQEQVFKQATAEQQPQQPPPVTTNSRKQKKVRSSSRSATANLESAACKARLDCDFSDLQITEATPSPEPSTWPKAPAASLKEQQSSQRCFERRATSCKEVRFKVNNRSSKNDDSRRAGRIIDLPTPPSTATTTSSSGPREKRYHRRSQSSRGRSPVTPESILERLSLSRGRLSSPDDCEALQHRPRCFLRTSKAGTLVVQDDSFSRYRRRCKQRNSSNENVRRDASQSTNSLKSPSMNGDCRLKPPPHETAVSSSLQNVAEVPAHTRRKVYPVRRYRSDALLGQPRRSSTSSETEAEARTAFSKDGADQDRDVNKLLRKFGNIRKRSKKGLMTIDPGAGILGTASERPTAR